MLAALATASWQAVVPIYVDAGDKQAQAAKEACANVGLRAS